ncbi:MAG: hypothetical protein IJA42_08130 [Bacteroidales bacterium]|nr:hypothetical protein [Bacteroidales bacterium]
MIDDKSYNFEYKNTIIPLKDVGIDSENTIINEFNSLISELNLKYSFAKLFHLSETDWGNYPISLHYKDSTLTLKDFVKENIEISKELKLLDSINGLEKKHQLDMTEIFLNSSGNKEMVLVCTETFRLFQDVYNTFALAKFSFLEGFRKLHLYSTLKWESGDYGQYWIRTSYLNNAIIWYNSCFDILLQTLWIGKRYYMNIFQLEDLWLKYDDVLVKCRENKIPEECFKSFANESCVKFVRLSANKLKHRNGLRYKEFCDTNLIMFNLGDYNSISTESSTDIEEVISNLTSYHKAFVALVDEVKEIIRIEFKNNYNIEI